MSEPEMLEINRLYCIMGRCEHDLRELKMEKLQTGGLAIGAVLVFYFGYRIFRRR